MVRKVNIAGFLHKAKECLVVDVRSPKEFADGHITFSINIPLFSDDERAVIGTLYQKQGRDPAIIKGLDIALPKVFQFVDSLKQSVHGPQVAVYCWRGGMRSELMAEVFSRAGFHVTVLEGGYKAYRKYIRESFMKKVRLTVLGGYTGCGKTEILKSMATMGEQVIDLENLASHKGSVFGALGQGPQPSSEQFENNLYSIWSGLDFRKRIWMEDESRSIGKVALPPPVFEQISNSRMVEVVLNKSFRINRLVSEYAGFDRELLAEALFRISEGLGGTRYKLALNALTKRDFGSVADIVLEYYDKAYRKAIEKRQNRDILRIELNGSNPDFHARAILETLKKNTDAIGLS